MEEEHDKGCPIKLDGDADCVTAPSLADQERFWRPVFEGDPLNRVAPRIPQRVDNERARLWEPIEWEPVEHRAIAQAMEQKKLPLEMRSYLLRLYKGSTTRLQVGGEMSAPVRPGQGVRQGDPLSPLIFNMVMDQGLGVLRDDMGYDLGGERVNALAFADDLILMASTRQGLQEQLNVLTQRLAK